MVQLIVRVASCCYNISSTAVTENCCLSDVFFFFFLSQKTFKQTQILFLVQVLLCRAQLVLELLFWKFLQCSYIRRPTSRSRLCSVWMTSESSDRICSFQLRLSWVPRTLEQSTAMEPAVKWCLAAIQTLCTLCTHQYHGIQKFHFIRKINARIRCEPGYQPAPETASTKTR